MTDLENYEEDIAEILIEELGETVIEAYRSLWFCSDEVRENFSNGVSAGVTAGQIYTEGN